MKPFEILFHLSGHPGKLSEGFVVFSDFLVNQLDIPGFLPQLFLDCHYALEDLFSGFLVNIQIDGEIFYLLGFSINKSIKFTLDFIRIPFNFIQRPIIPVHLPVQCKHQNHN